MKKIVMISGILIFLSAIGCDVLYDFTQKPFDNIADPQSDSYIDRMTVTAKWNENFWDGAVFGE